MNHSLTAVILAAGRGSRMGECPKVLIEIEGKPMIRGIVDALMLTAIDRIIVVVGELKPRIEAVLPEQVVYAYQKEPLGTGDAFCQALKIMQPNENCMVLPADLPFLDADIIQSIISAYESDPEQLLVVGMEVENPKGYGRILQSEEGIRIIEEKDASKEEQNIHQVNTAIYCFPSALIRPLLPYLKNDNMAKEYYFTDFIKMLAEIKKVRVLILPEDYKLKGVNKPEDLKALIEEKKVHDESNK